MSNSIYSLIDKLRNSSRDWNRDCRTHDLFKLLSVVLEKTLESPLDCKEIQLIILQEISPEYSLEGLMSKLKL